MMEDRAVSMPLQYVLLVAIIALLAGGLFVGTGSYVQSQQEDATRDGLQVVGTRLVSDITAVDRLARRLDRSDTLTVTVETPETVAGSTYTMTITHVSDDQYDLFLTSPTIDGDVTVQLFSSHEIKQGSVASGRLEVGYDPLTDRLEVHNVY